MGIQQKTVLLVLMLCGQQCPPVRSNQHCAKFIFPSLTSNILTTAVNTTLSLPFELQQHNCTAQNLVLTVAKRNSTGRLSYHCKLLHTDGKCDALTQQVQCKCLKEPGQYKFTKTAELNDDGTWVWMFGEGHAEEKTINFHITQPPSITRLTLASYEDSLPRPATPNDTVDVVCTWDAGNPPTAANLLDRHGAILQNVSDVTGKIRYRFAAVGCQDAGLIRCEAPGAEQNQSATLLVKCPPMLVRTNPEFSVAAARNEEVTFPVRMHTKVITSCQLAKVMSTTNSQSPRSQQNKDCLSSLTVTGTPPDLTVSIRLNNVRTQDQGTWSLTLTNDAGSSHMNVTIFLHVTGEVSSAQGHSAESLLPSWMTAAAAVVAAGAVVFYVVFWACRRSRREGSKYRLPAPRCDACSLRMQSSFGSLSGDLLASRRLARSEECVMIHNVLYQRSASLLEIPEEDARCVFDIDNGPTAPLPCELYGEKEGDYAEVGDRAEGGKDCKFAAEENDFYVSIQDILERKRQARESRSSHAHYPIVSQD